MSNKAKLIDLSKCTGCRGCQLACKQWNANPAKQTTNRGTYQNPPDLQPNTWTLIRFQEISNGNGVKWLFRKDGCMHCTDAACVEVCPADALYHTKFGTVGVRRENCIGCGACVDACPFGIPKLDAETEKAFKCDMCTTRLENKLEPACVKACPTGALQFGDQADMMKKAYKRVKELGGDASVYGDKFVDGTHVIYVLTEKVGVYDELPVKPEKQATLWKNLFKPFGLLAAGGLIGPSFLRYITHDPKSPE
jgi:formate dehydrogenase iron-sulfur subunit